MSKTVGPVTYAVFVNEQLIRDFPLDVELRQAWGRHDLFFIRIEYYRGLDLTARTLWADNSPIRIIWGQTPGNTQTWYGYVNHHTVDSNADSGSRAMQVTYTCIGTSKPMNTDKTRRWGDVTGTYMAKKIAGEYGLRAVLTATNWVLPSETQANESDFRFLNRMADKIGYRFWVSGGTLYFIDPAVVIQGGVNQNVPSFSMDKSFVYLDTMRNFHMARGDNLPGSTQATRRIYGIDQASGNVFSVTANNPGTVTSGITQIITDWPVDNLNQAQNFVNARQSRSQFWQAATAELYGNSLVYPGKLIELKGKQLTDEATGFWIVGSACHVMRASGTPDPTKDRYVTHVELLKNTALTLPVLKNTTKISPEFTTCVLYKGVWNSAIQTVIYDNPPGH